MLRALIVTYAFPPTGGAGVARVQKLCKFLPELGIAPTVLTVANPSVPVSDPTLSADGVVEVIRVPTLEPPYAVKQAGWSAQADDHPSLRRRATRLGMSIGRSLLLPDPQILWQPAAQLSLARELRRGIDVVFISAPPFSSFLLAPLAHLRDAAVVLDYRDEWATLRDSYEMFGPLQRAAGAWMESTLLRRADVVTTATSAFARRLLVQFPFLEVDQVRAIPNGFDPDDFPGERPEPPLDKFALTYAGTVFALTRPVGLLEAIRRLHRDAPALAARLRTRFFGRIVDTERHLFDDAESIGVDCIGYVDKQRAMLEQAASHMTLCLLDDVPGTERIYPAKVFELMQLGRPCLTLAPPGALADLVRQHHLGEVAHPRDPAEIAAILDRALREFEAGRYVAEAHPVGIEHYHRKALAGEFARAFEDAVAQVRARGGKGRKAA